LALVEAEAARGGRLEGEYTFCELMKHWSKKGYRLHIWLGEQVKLGTVTQRRVGPVWYYRVK
jgi:hypothetical protein